MSVAVKLIHVSKICSFTLKKPRHFLKQLSAVVYRNM